MAPITISHDAVVADYQRRLAALTHENVTLGLMLEQAMQQLAAANESVPSPRQVRVPSEPVDCATEGTKE